MSEVSNTAAQRRNLVIVRAGDRSLHGGWLRDVDARNWDLHISYYGNRPDPYPEHAGAASLTRDPGTKFIGLKNLLQSNHDWKQKYDYICLADDDIDATGKEWNIYFNVVLNIAPVLAQPALNHVSYYSHGITLRRKPYLYREVNFVESMMPTFRADKLFDFVDFFDDNQSSLGLDYVWSRSCEAAGELIIIVDAVGFVHTRAIGAGGQYAGFNGKQSLLEDIEKILQLHGIKAIIPVSLRGIRARGGAESRKYILNYQPLRARLFRKLKTLMGLKEISIVR